MDGKPDGLTLKIALEEAREHLRMEKRPFIELMKYADCSVELYAPHGKDLQKPHEQDELYIVSHGRARFRRAEATVSCEAGDLLFVPARVPHRFEEFSADFETWVIFFGPKGGSLPDAP